MAGVLTLGAALANCAWVLAPLVGGTLDPVHSLVSELGARDQPNTWFFHAGDLLAGTLAVAAALLLGRDLPRTPWLTTARMGLLVYGACTAADAFLPVDCAVTVDATCRAAEIAGQVSIQHLLHTVTGTIESTSAVLVALGAGLGLRHEWPARARFWRISALVLVALNAAIVVDYLTHGPGLGVVQRVSLILWSIVLAVAGWSLLRSPGRPRPPEVPVLDQVELAVEVPTIPGLVVHVEVHEPGARGAALFVTGLGLPRQVWHPVLRGLAGITTVLYDRPGLGDSPAWPQPPNGLADQVRILHATVGALRHRGFLAPGAPLVLVGHSYGATIAEAAVRLDPGLANGLVLVDPSDPEGEAAQSVPAHPIRWADRALARGGIGVRRAGLIVTWATKAIGTSNVDAAALPPAARSALASARHLRGSLAELTRAPGESAELLDLQRVSPALGLHAQVLIAVRRGWPLYGGHPGWVARMTQQARSLGAETTMLQCAHLVSLDDPQAVARAVRGACELAAGADHASS